jgi:hypothetical protein
VVFGLQDSQPNFFLNSLVNTSSGTLFYAVLLTLAVQRKGNSCGQGYEDLKGLSYCGALGSLFRYFELAQLTGGGLGRSKSATNIMQAH